MSIGFGSWKIFHHVYEKEKLERDLNMPKSEVVFVDNSSKPFKFRIKRDCSSYKPAYFNKNYKTMPKDF